MRNELGPIAILPRPVPFKEGDNGMFAQDLLPIGIVLVGQCVSVAESRRTNGSSYFR